jgi:hypothetical protein
MFSCFLSRDPGEHRRVKSPCYLGSRHIHPSSVPARHHQCDNCFPRDNDEIEASALGEREGALGVVVRDGKAQKLSSNGAGFHEVEAGKARNEIVDLVAILVLNTKIVDD